MDIAALEREWDHTAALMAYITNSFKDKNSPAVTVAQLHPLRQDAIEQRKRHPFEHLKKAIGINGNRRSD